MDFMKPDSVLDLSNIRQVLQRMEDTIIFNFIERSQFFTCPSVYENDKFPIPNFHGSFLDWLLSQHERIQSQVRRYQAPDEYPFFPDSVEPSFLPKIKYPKILANYADKININDDIMKVYVDAIAPGISSTEGDQMVNLGSTAMADIDALQSLSRRIHFGMFVAEAKFRNEREKYTKLIKNKDVQGISEAITNSAVEQKILKRLLEKAKAYGMDPTLKFTQHIESKVKPEVVVNIYKDYVIPLTKKVEIDYLMRRLEDDE